MNERVEPQPPHERREEAREEARQIVEAEGMAAVEAEVTRLKEREKELAEQEERLNRTFHVYGLLRRELEEAGLLRRYLADERERLPELTLEDLVDVNVLELFAGHGTTTLGVLAVWSPLTERYPYPAQVLATATEAVFGLSEEALSSHEFPAEESEYEDFGVVVDAGTTWRDAAQRVREKTEDYRQEWIEVSQRWNEVTDRLAAYEDLAAECRDRPEYRKWSAGERVTERAVDLLAAYNREAHVVVAMNDLHADGGLLEQLEYSNPRSKFVALQEALRGSGWKYENGNPDSFVAALAGALQEVNELPDHLEGLARSRKNLVDEAGADG